ncbi:MAG: T9SS type A sorting domain-containing protein [Bacteroidota bacterium]
MKRIISILLLQLTCASVYAQVNLVRNPSFEQHTQCPNAFDQIQFANYWSSIDTIDIDPICSPEYCNKCGSGVVAIPQGQNYFQYPRNGDGMIEVMMFYDEIDIPPLPQEAYFRDYLQGKLYQPLVAGKQYCVSFYTVLEESSDYAIANIGAYLHDGNIDHTDSAGCDTPKTAYIPQVENTTIIYDTLHWVKVEGTLTAIGTEKFITIGNFRDKAHTNYVPYISLCGCGWSWYLIDDVSVIASDAIAYAGHDTIIGVGDSAYIGLHDEAMPCTWYVQGNSTPIDSGGGIWVKPTTTTSYVVKQTLCGVSTYDTVKVIVWPQGVANVYGANYARVYPNPATDNVTFSYAIPYVSNSLALTITNLMGQVIQTFSLPDKSGQVQWNTSALANGLYLYKLTDQSNVLQIGKITVQR